MPNESGSAILTVFSNLIDQIKSTRPVRTDGKALTTGFVYSQMVLGRMVDPRDYTNPWSPMGGSTLQDAVKSMPAPAGSPASGGSSAPTPDPKFRRALDAAFKTAELVDNMIMVTKDGSFLEYPTQRRISLNYESIISSMQPTPMPPISPEIQKQIDDSKKVLYELDDEGNIVGKSKLYKLYVKNSQAFAKAKKDYAEAQASALADPVKADSWPQTSVFYQQQVDEAWDTFKTEGAEKIERALDIIESVGVSMQDHMIAKARKLYDAWNLGLAGVPIAMPYSYIEPTRWYDIDDDTEGWQKLTITSDQYNSHTASQDETNFKDHWESHFSSDSGGGAVGFAFAFVAADGGTSLSSSSAASSGSSASAHQFHNDAKNLTIDIEYGMCTIHRPWLLGDLFYMKNWYSVNNLKNAISDGSIDNQANSDKTQLPMIPNQFLVIRKVTISATDWGSDGQTFQAMHSESRGQDQSESDYVSAGGGFSLGFITVGGHGSHSSSDSSADSSGSTSHQASADYGWRFINNTLEVQGAQIIAWLSEIVPACAPLDDPGLKKNNK